MRAFDRLATAAFTALSLLGPVPATAQSGHEAAFVLGLMESMNALSIRFNREVCGYILRHPNGAYSSTKASWGGHATCASFPVDPSVEVVSSWHTHAAWATDYDGEVPSIQDVEGDMNQGINGWVGTPGGRLWFVDWQIGVARQYCGWGCLPSDPNFLADDFDPVPAVLSLDDLYDRFGG